MRPLRRTTIAATLAVILIAAIVVGILFVDLAGNQEASKLYSYPISIEEKTYLVTVRTNWTSKPNVYLPEYGAKYFSVDFNGPQRALVFFNVTFPNDLIWGNISVVWKYYVQSSDRYVLSGNGSHTSVQMMFSHVAAVEHFEIRGTEGAW